MLQIDVPDTDAIMTAKMGKAKEAAVAADVVAIEAAGVVEEDTAVGTANVDRLELLKNAVIKTKGVTV